MKATKVFILAAMALMLYGCAYLVAAGTGAAIGAGTYAYLRGELCIDYPYAYDAVWDATLKALEDCGIAVYQKEKDALEGQIKGKRATGGEVVVKLQNKGTSTLVRIRVGLFGDEKASLMIKEKIDRRLTG